MILPRRTIIPSRPCHAEGKALYYVIRSSPWPGRSGVRSHSLLFFFRRGLLVGCSPELLAVRYARLQLSSAAKFITTGWLRNAWPARFGHKFNNKKLPMSSSLDY